MALYTYETTDPAKPAQQFELRQSMLDEPFTTHPETGEPIQRVITGGFGFSIRGGQKQSPAPQPAARGGCCGGGCACR